MGCRAGRLGCWTLLLTMLCGCAGIMAGLEESPRRAIGTAETSSWRSIPADAMAISIDSSLFTNAPLTQYRPSQGDFEGYGLAHFRDDNDRSIRLVYIVNEEALRTTDRDVSDLEDYRAVALRAQPNRNTDIRILEQGTIEFWGEPLPYEFTTQRVYSGPPLPPINLSPSEYDSLPGAEHRQCISFVWADARRVTMIVGDVCEYSDRVPDPVSGQEVAMILQRLDIRLR